MERDAICSRRPVRQMVHFSPSTDSVLPKLPLVDTASVVAVCLSSPRSSTSTLATFSYGIGLKATCWHLETMVGSRSVVWVAVRIMTVPLGGSSRILRIAFDASRFMACASLMITIRQFPSRGANLSCLDTALTWSILIKAPSGFTVIMSGWAPEITF